MFANIRASLTPRLSGFFLSLNANGASRLAPVLCRHQHQTSKSNVRVLYDGLCPICVTEIRALQFLQRKKPEKVDFVDISLPDYDGSKYMGVDYDVAMEEMHVIDEKDQVHRGVPAFAVMYSAVGLGFLGRLMTWPPVRPVMDRAYAVFARNRLKWTGRQDCTSGRCEKRP
ncbi:uncharacterized protein ACB057_014633 [Neosynchiropus ocellatus]